MERLLSHRKDHFDWKKVEILSNSLTNFKTAIEVEGYGLIDLHGKLKKSSVLIMSQSLI